MRASKVEDPGNTDVATESTNRRSSKRNSLASRGAGNAFEDGLDTPDVEILLAKDADERAAEGGPSLLARSISEFAGTFFLVLSVGVAVQTSGNLPPVGIGMILAIQIYSYGSVSGGMFNPAVTLAVLLSGRRRIKPDVAGISMGSQLLGGCIAGLFAYAITNKSFCFEHDANSIRSNVITSLFLEVFYTTALCNTVLTSGTSLDVPNQYFGFAIGLTVTSAAYACSGFDQGSFNPAVTFGINFGNLVNSDASQSCEAGSWILFLFAPFLGSILSAIVFRTTRIREYKEDPLSIGIGLPEKLAAEFVGTFFLVLTVGVAVVGANGMAAVAIGMMLAVQIYTFGSVSGACFNPAVTFAVLLSGRGKIEPLQAAAYAGVQLIAGLIAASFALLITDKTFYFDIDQTPEGGAGSSFFLEMLCTAALCMAVLTTGTSKDAPNHYFGFAIGGTVTAMAITCGKYNQGSFNPAVTFGINMANYFNGNNSGTPSGGSWMIFLFGPICGSLLAVMLFIGTRIQEFAPSDFPLLSNQGLTSTVGKEETE